jgi:hypothetical protein
MFRYLIPLLAAAISAGFQPRAEAQELAAVGVHVGSWHSEPGFNNTNPGVYVRTADGWTLGAYRNSVRRTSTYAGWTTGVDLAAGVRAEVTVGAIAGYFRPVLPMAVPSVRFALGEHLGARLILIPRINPKLGAHVVSLAIDWSL